jgi:hypothetical protein
LNAAINMATRGARVTAVDPTPPAAQQIAKLSSLGGEFMQGTANQVVSESADYLVWYFPWRIGGAGSFIRGGTWEAVDQAVRIVRPGGVVTLVTEDLQTASYLSGQAARLRGVEVVQIGSTAACAAPGATGKQVPGMSPDLRVHLINIYTHLSR